MKKEWKHYEGEAWLDVELRRDFRTRLRLFWQLVIKRQPLSVSLHFSPPETEVYIDDIIVK